MQTGGASHGDVFLIFTVLFLVELLQGGLQELYKHIDVLYSHTHIFYIIYSSTTMYNVNTCNYHIWKYYDTTNNTNMSWQLTFFYHLTPLILKIMVLVPHQEIPIPGLLSKHH